MNLKLLLDYQGQGLHLFPLHWPTEKAGEPGPGRCSCGRVPCDRAGKHPRTKHGLKDATTDPRRIERWWQSWPEANVGIATGESGLVVIDLDVKGGGEERWKALAAEHGFPATLTASTGGGGKHLYYLAPEEPVRSRVAALGAGIDVRAQGGYVVAPPSLHSSGERYRWLGELLIPEPLPDMLKELLLRRGPSLSGSSDDGGSIPEGERNDTLFRKGCAMRGMGFTEEEIAAALRILNTRCVPPLGEEELRGVARNAARYPAGDRPVRPSPPSPLSLPGRGGEDHRSSDLRLRAVSRGTMSDGEDTARGPSSELQTTDLATPPLPGRERASRSDVGRSPGGEGRTGEGRSGDDPPHLTDQGNAQRLIARHGKDLRYCHAWKCWLVWAGKRWQRDGDGAVMRRAKATVAGIRSESLALPEGDEQRALLRHALKSESEARLRAMIALAESEPGIPVAPDDLDADPLLLCCANGTLDLRTGELRPHRREDLITRIVSTPFEPTAEAPRWNAFLGRVMAGDKEMIGYLQRAAGYSLTGLTGEETLFFLHGSGRNGKSRFLGALRHLLGEYARVTRPETVMARDRAGIPNDVAALAGARLVATTEIEDGTRLAESLIKQLTGSDTVSARFLHGEFFEFLPQFKLWLAANHKPRIHGTDNAIWERIHLIPFTVTIPPEERDKGLAGKLSRENAGILRWLVEGCLAWQRDGLNPPGKVRAATAAYRAEMDVLANFLEARCVVDERGSVLAGQLYEVYKDWCKTNNEREWSKRAFGTRLGERGFVPGRLGSGDRTWCGLALRHPFADTTDTTGGCPH